ncbi:hypothetical protein T484DRAFT_2024254 [Baffinella frigidus]|nr:hypothetical protein T484DRAFT_2024254 [Cryptophyta sp. CCMP2293]
MAHLERRRRCAVVQRLVDIGDGSILRLVDIGDEIWQQPRRDIPLYQATLRGQHTDIGRGFPRRQSLCGGQNHSDRVEHCDQRYQEDSGQARVVNEACQPLQALVLLSTPVRGRWEHFPTDTPKTPASGTVDVTRSEGRNTSQVLVKKKKPSERTKRNLGDTVAFRDTEEHRALMDQGQHRAAFHSQQQGQKVWRGAGINAQGGPDARITPGNYSLGSLVPSSGSTNTTSPCFLRRRSSGRESRGVSGIPFTNGSLTLPVGWLAPGSSGAVKGFAGRMASLPHSDHVKYTQHLEHLSKTNGYIDPASNPFAGQPPHLKPPAQQADAGAAKCLPK